MKKVIIFAIALIAAVSCNNKPAERDVITIDIQDGRYSLTERSVPETELSDEQVIKRDDGSVVRRRSLAITETWKKRTSSEVEVRDGKIYMPALTDDEAFWLEFGFTLSEYGKRDVTLTFPNDYSIQIKFHQDELGVICYNAYLIREIKGKYNGLSYSYSCSYDLAEGVLSPHTKPLTLAADRMLTVSL